MMCPRPSLLGCALLAASPAVHATVDLFDWEKVQLLDSSLGSRSVHALDGPSRRAANASCKAFPGDAAWPSESQWAALNETLEGALIKSVPHASVCYEGPYYDEASCATITANWTNSYIHDDDPIEMLSPVYQGLTCQPPTLYEGGINSGNCTLGGYPAYAVAATNVKQIQAAVKFAGETGVRFVIKNTGHDFSGKSGGAGALSVWTKNLKGITYQENYVDEGTGYSGPAFKAGAGVRAWEIYEAAAAEGKVVVGGEGQVSTVGVMGGYIQGGGHSPLSSMYGMAADQVLSMEVVLANGTFVTASAGENADLFWALKGGGGATYGIATSTVVKAWPDMPVTGSKFSWTSANITNETFWAGVRAYLDYFPENAEQQTYSYWFVIQLGGGVKQFLMQPFFAPNKTLEQTQAILAPWFADLAALGITFTPRTTHYDNFYDAWKAEFPLEVVQKTHVATGSRLFPRSAWDQEETLNATFDAIRTSSDAGNTIIAFNMAPKLHEANAENSVNPAWRKTVMHALQSVNWQNNSTRDYIMERRAWFNDVAMQRWIDVSPGAGCYLGESNRMESGWKQSFYGESYDRLLDVKKQVDPDDVFWAATAVGSDAWAVDSVDGLPNENGRLCRTGA
ncbi:putative fad binding domain-containing protein [Diplodia seriata]|uniref:Putative fad binding domain-containing protein n=1 Tax=Diplodia seriata TaxID=420778 RepID=A0A0G2GUF9_9PEZI|nr:putative fad binding domain-containing protein [Diplodia seriata]